MIMWLFNLTITKVNQHIMSSCDFWKEYCLIVEFSRQNTLRWANLKHFSKQLAGWRRLLSIFWELYIFGIVFSQWCWYKLLNNCVVETDVAVMKQYSWIPRRTNILCLTSSFYVISTQKLQQWIAEKNKQNDSSQVINIQKKIKNRATKIIFWNN